MAARAQAGRELTPRGTDCQSVQELPHRGRACHGLAGSHGQGRFEETLKTAFRSTEDGLPIHPTMRRITNPSYDETDYQSVLRWFFFNLRVELDVDHQVVRDLFQVVLELFLSQSGWQAQLSRCAKKPAA